MSIDQLRADMKDSIAGLKAMGALTTTSELVDHLKNTLWPTMEAIADELEEQDGCIEDLMNGSEDILQPETGAKLLAGFTAAVMLANEFRSRLTAQDDPKHQVALRQFDALANECIDIIQTITVPEDLEEPEDAEEDDEEEED